MLQRAIPPFSTEPYFRKIGKPQVFIDRFTFSRPGNNFMLTVKNGKNGRFRVSAASISMDRKQVIGVSDFNNQVNLITRAIALKTTNEIKVELFSKPGDFITVNIMGLDRNTPPVADAGADQTVLAHDTVRLDGSRSADPMGFADLFLVICVTPFRQRSLSRKSFIRQSHIPDGRAGRICRAVGRK